MSAPSNIRAAFETAFPADKPVQDYLVSNVSTFLDVTAGTAEASKAVVLNASKGITTITSATITTLTSTTGNITTVNATDVDAGASGTAGTVDIFPATASKGKLQLACTNQTGDTTVTLNANAMGQATTVNLKDPGAASASLLTTTDTTAAATTSTAVEITRACDVSTSLVLVGGTSLAVTEASHANRTIGLDHTAAASTCTLPAATGSGMYVRFVVVAANTNEHRIKVTGNDEFVGSVNLLDRDAAAQTAYFAADGVDNDQIALNAGTKGGLQGDWIEVMDIAADTWAVWGQLQCPAGSNPASPFATGQAT